MGKNNFKNKMASTERIRINRLSHNKLDYQVLVRGGEKGTVEKMPATMRSFPKCESLLLKLKKYQFAFALLLKLGKLSTLMNDFMVSHRLHLTKKWLLFKS